MASAASEAATLNVALNGTDTSGCGTAAAPCRSLQHAITLASPGDKIVVGPGRYTSSAAPGCACMVLVNKALTIESREGALLTILDAQGADLDVVQIAVSGVTFGGTGRGFTLQGALKSGLATPSTVETAVIVANVARGNGDHGFLLRSLDGYRVSDNIAQHNGLNGFNDVSGTNGTYERNTATGNAEYGFQFSFTTHGVITDNGALENGNHGFSVEFGEGLALTKNTAHANAFHGFNLVRNAGNTYRTNVARSNVQIGFDVGFGESDAVMADNVTVDNGTGVRVDDALRLTFTGNTVASNEIGLVLTDRTDDADIRRNAFIGNRGDGIRTASTSVTVTQNNIFGNEVCGLNKTVAGAFSATQNFWGAAAGPGGDPADKPCGLGGLVATPFATRAFNIPVKAGQ